MDMQKNKPWNNELDKIRSVLARVPIEIEVK